MIAYRTSAAHAAPASIRPANPTISLSPIIRPMRHVRNQLVDPITTPHAMEITCGLDIHPNARSCLDHLSQYPGDGHVDGSSLGMARNQCWRIDDAVGLHHGRCGEPRGLFGVVDP